MAIPSLKMLPLLTNNMERAPRPPIFRPMDIASSGMSLGTESTVNGRQASGTATPATRDRRQSSSSPRTAANSSCTGAHIGHVVMIVEIFVAGSGQLIVPCTRL